MLLRYVGGFVRVTLVVVIVVEIQFVVGAPLGIN
jgi:hypothetical protein